jgi:hypothetical protein
MKCAALGQRKRVMLLEVAKKLYQEAVASFTVVVRLNPNYKRWPKLAS